MPNLKSAKKRLRQTETKSAANAPIRTRVKSTRRQFMESIASGEKTQSTDAFKAYCSALDKAAKVGIIKKNTAIRRKSRAAGHLAALS